MDMKEKMRFVAQLVENNELVIYDVKAGIVQSDCSIRGVSCNGSAVQVWVKECPCHSSPKPFAEVSGATFLPCGECCDGCGCELERYTSPNGW